jgi:D-sedoheptulose 7-phosphate isomerase
MSVKSMRREISKTIAMLDALLADDLALGAAARIAAVGADAIRRGNKIMFCGNGGSAADSQHLAAELVGKLSLDRPGMAALALTVDTSALTAIGNDFGYDQVFARQLEALGRPGDLLIGISTSGRSRNVVAALETARRMGITTVAMTGSQRGPMAEVSDIWLPIPHTETQKIQEGHIVLGHAVCELVESTIFGHQEP